MRYFIFVFFLCCGLRTSFGDCSGGMCARADLLNRAKNYGLGGENVASQKAKLYMEEANKLRKESESEKDQSKKEELLEEAEEKEVKALQELAQAKANENSAAQNAHSEHRLNQGQKSGGGGENDMPMQPPQQQQQQKQEKKEEEEESDPRIAQLMKPVPFEIPKQPKEMQNLGNTKSKYISPDLVSPEQLFSKWKSNSM